MTLLANLEEKSATKPRLLIVDDQTLNIQVLFEAFSQNYEVFMSTNGAGALVSCVKHLPDLVILDVVMPEMDGFEVCSRLKANPITADIPVIFVTGQTDDESEERGLAVGAVDFISKPFNIKLVQARVNAHVALKRQSDVLRSIAFVDGLTDVRNRRYFDEHLSTEVARSKRNSSPLSIALMDVDYFKRFNDCYGHQAGDDCLKRLAKICQSCIKRPVDFVARYGGEEFVCVFPDTPITGAIALAETIRTSVIACAIPHAGSRVTPWVTLSIGVASMTGKSTDEPETLLRLADENLYKCKNSGRNQVFGCEVGSFTAL